MRIRMVVRSGSLALGLLGFAVAGVAQGVVSTRSSGRVTVDSSSAVTARDTSVLERSVSFDFRRVRLEEALAEIDRQAHLGLSFTPVVVPVNRRITLRTEKMTAGEALARVLAGTGVRVKETASGTVLLVKDTATSDASFKPGQGGGGTLVGRVTDAKTGAAIGSAEVLLNDTQWRTVTDTGGRYRLAEVDAGSYTLMVRRFGYTKQSQAVAVREGQTDTVSVALAPVVVALDELITTATGQQRRRDLGNAITTIRADSVMQTAPIQNLTDLLEHRVPGLTVQHTTGAPGDPSKLRLRGLGSALRSNDPVVIVDGVRVYAAQSDARSGNLTNLAPSVPGLLRDQATRPAGAPAPSPLDQIDPNIIETIEVFKGPSAATLYGADAANGVIVITTKKGRAGPTQWTANFTYGRTVSPGQYPTGYFRWGHDTLSAVGTEQHYCSLLELLCVQDSLVQFQAMNDPSLTVLGHGHSTGVSLTALGGTSTLTYRITGTYNDNVGVLTLPTYEVDRFQNQFNQAPPDWMRRPLGYTNWAVSSEVTAHLGQTADVHLTTSLARSVQSRSTLEDQLAILSGGYVDKVRGIYYAPLVIGSGLRNATFDVYTLDSTGAFLSSYYTRRTASTITLTTGLGTEWRPRSWFNATARAGLNMIPRDDHLLLPAGLLTATDSGTVAVGTGRSLVSNFDVQGTFTKRLGLGFVFLTNLGANLVTTNTHDLVSSASGLVPGTTAITGARSIGATESATNTSVYGWYIEPRIAGQRISISTGLRLDGSSAYGVRFTQTGSGGGGGFLKNLLSLPKLNGSWVISEESWFPFNALFSSLQLRAAYGQSQVQPGPADRLRLYTGTTGQVNSQLNLTTLGNTKLRPERSTEFEGGFLADVLDSRISVDFSVYRKLQVDALMNMQLPPSVNGGGSVLTNIGNIRNTGLELSFGVTPVRSPTVTWNTQLNFSRNNNILTKLGDGVPANKEQGLAEGYPVGSRWTRPILGFADQNGDGVLQPGEIQVGDSLVFMGRLMPAYQSSLFTNLKLLGGAVGVSAGFSYDAGQTQIDQTLRTNFVLVRALVDASVPLDQQAAIWASTRVTNPTDYGLMQEVSTFRFNSLSVNYRVPTSVARLFRAQQLTVAVQGSNLGLHSTYRGKDPNVNSWSPGENIVDTGQLPEPRLWQMQVNLQF